MKLAPFLGFAFFAAGTFAAPRPKHATESLVRRELFSSRPQHLGNTTSGTEAANTVSLNWAGAVLGYTGNPFVSVDGTFTVPTAVDPGTTVAIWIGIDGENRTPPVIQGGIAVAMESDGTAQYASWTEWYPDPPVFYDQTEFTFRPGDVLNLGLTVSSLKASLIIENTTLGGTLRKEFSPSDPSYPALGKTAEWIVERANGMTLMNFGTVTFSSCSASTADRRIGLYRAVPSSIQESQTSSRIIAVGSVPNPGTVQVVYTGP